MIVPFLFLYPPAFGGVRSPEGGNCKGLLWPNFLWEITRDYPRHGSSGRGDRSHCRRVDIRQRGFLSSRVAILRWDCSNCRGIDTST